MVALASVPAAAMPGKKSVGSRPGAVGAGGLPPGGHAGGERGDIPAALRGVPARRRNPAHRPANASAMRSTTPTNAWIFGVYVDGELASSIRLHVAHRQSPVLPALNVFSDLLSPEIAAGKTIIDPTRFVIDRTASRRYPELCYVTTRLAVAGLGILQHQPAARHRAGRAPGLLPARVRPPARLRAPSLSLAHQADLPHGARLRAGARARACSAIPSSAPPSSSAGCCLPAPRAGAAPGGLGGLHRRQPGRQKTIASAGRSRNLGARRKAGEA